MGHTSFVYLKGSFGSQPDECSDIVAAMIQKKELNSSCLLVNEEKSLRQPMPMAKWLAFVMKTISMAFQIPKKESLPDTVMTDESSSYRKLARIA